MKIDAFGLSSDKAWDYENGFFLTSHVTRLAKTIAHYELYKKIVNLPGQVIECGVYKGASLVRFATFREMLENPYSRKIVGFDAFGKFPRQADPEDNDYINKFEKISGNGISLADMEKVLAYKSITNVDLIEGDIETTIPEYVSQHPELKVALLHIDVDVYQPTSVILRHLFHKVVSQGIILLDDYGTVRGETKAVDEFLQGQNITIQKLPISHIPSYIKI